MRPKSIKSPADILIVDDTPANLRLLSTMLTDQGHRVRAVTSGTRALASIQVAIPDLVLLDIRMPGMDGYEFCKILKSDDKTRDIPVIFISALHNTDDKLKAFTVGGVDYVTKPFQFEEVLARVETHLALRNLQLQLQVANEKMEHELALAGEVQASFLPKKPHQLPGWQLSISLIPARETSGDFFDTIALPGDRMAILIADVIDKGVGAALFMTLSSTLLRTFAIEYPSQPELVLKEVNHRILNDTSAKQFVTVFYGVLDSQTGEFCYANAGHCPPYLVRGGEDTGVYQLTRTGIPLGLFNDRVWGQEQVQLAPEDVLILFTDGISEAQNPRAEFYGRDRFQNIVRNARAKSADEVKEIILADVYAFVEDAPLMDDLGLIVLSRNFPGNKARPVN